MKSDKLIKLIILEDDKDWCELYKESIDDYNSEDTNVYTLECSVADNMNQFYELMFTNDYDVLIADINIKDIMDGNTAIKKAVEKLRIPVFVVSGDVSKLESNEKESCIYRIYQRDQIDLEDLFKEIADMFAENDYNILKLGGEIDNKINKIYRESINDANLINTFRKQKNRLVRYITSRIADELRISDRYKHDEYKTIEVVIMPGIGEKIYSGDIVEYNNADYVIMNPPCDIEQNKTDFYLLCKIVYEPLNEVFNKKTEENRKLALGNFVNNNKSRYHLIPPTYKYKGGVLDFQNIITVGINDLIAEHKKATLAIEFMKDIRCRFSSYYARQGQPQLIVDEVYELLANNS